MNEIYIFKLILHKIFNKILWNSQKIAKYVLYSLLRMALVFVEIVMSLARNVTLAHFNLHKFEVKRT